MKTTRFVPNIPILTQLFDGTKISDVRLAAIKYKFIHEIYDDKQLKKFDTIIKNEVIPLLQDANKKLKTVLRGDAFLFPDIIKIYTDWGCGASYSTDKKDKSFVIIRLGVQGDEKGFRSFMKDTATIHEYIHTLIEQSLIQKYNIPQELKERIVDLIGYFYLNIPVQEFYKNSFANTYITCDTIENDLTGAVQRMMIDYNQLQNAKINQSKD